MHWPGSVDALMLDGQVKVGFSVSFTITVKLQAAVLPNASVTVKPLPVIPSGKTEPLPIPEVCVKLDPAQLSPEVTL